MFLIDVPGCVQCSEVYQFTFLTYSSLSYEVTVITHVWSVPCGVESWWYDGLDPQVGEWVRQDQGLNP
jgi:hypothetical protein